MPPGITPEAIDRPLIVAYEAHLRTLGVAPATIGLWLVALRSFFELCAREGWAAIPERPLIYREDFPRHVQQLNAHLDDLRPVYRSMTLVLEECGMRIGELCTLRLDCLSRDPEGDYFLGYDQPKMRKEIQIPISRELALVIQEQQHAVRHRWSGSVTWLFPDRKGRPVPTNAYRRATNELAYQHHVRDTTGVLSPTLLTARPTPVPKPVSVPRSPLGAPVTFAYQVQPADFGSHDAQHMRHAHSCGPGGFLSKDA